MQEMLGSAYAAGADADDAPTTTKSTPAQPEQDPSSSPPPPPPGAREPNLPHGEQAKKRGAGGGAGVAERVRAMAQSWWKRMRRWWRNLVEAVRRWAGSNASAGAAPKKAKSRKGS